MGIHLNKHGGLTVSQREQADRMGISHEKYKEIILKRLEQMRGGPPPDWEKCRKIRKINAKNPVLVVGHGPKWKKLVQKAKDWKYTLVAVDSCLKDMLEMKIIPDYVVTLESSRPTCALFHFDPVLLKGHDVQIIHSSITRPEVIEKFKNQKHKIRQFVFDEEPRCSNVGLFAINFAIKELRADKILLIGFEHEGSEYDYSVYRIWNTDFWYFVRKWPKKIIVNCSEGGKLYYRDYVLEGKIDEIKV